MTTVTETPAANNPATVPDADELQAMLRQALDNNRRFQSLVQELRQMMPLPSPAVVDVLRPAASVAAAVDACHTIRAFIQTLSGWEVEEDAMAAMTAVGLLERLAEATAPATDRVASDVAVAEAADADEPAEDDDDEDDAPGTRTYHVYYVGEVNRRRSARLDVVDDEIDDAIRGHYHGDYDDVEHIGTLTVHVNALRFEIEAEAMAAFGGHVGHSGRPASARYCEASEWDRIAGEVAVVLLTWPRYAVQTPEGLAENPGPATPDAIAAAIGRSVLDVREAVAELRKPPIG